MNSMLHIVNKSPSERPALASCLRVASDGDSILFIEDGVYAAFKNSVFSEPLQACDRELKWYVLQADIQARGLQNDEYIDGVKIVDYAGFVDLVANHAVNQSWL